MRVKEPITACLKCGGDVWDNRGNKKSPKGPDFKCKDQECGEGFWFEKPKGQPSGGGRGSYSPPPATTFEQIAIGYKNAVACARKVWGDKIPAAELRSAADTVFIAMQKGGTLRLMGAKKPPQPEDAGYGEDAEADDGSDLPF